MKESTRLAGRESGQQGEAAQLLKDQGDDGFLVQLLNGCGDLVLLEKLPCFDDDDDDGKTYLRYHLGSSCCDPAVTNPTHISEDVGSIPGLFQWVEDLALLSAVV